MTTTPDPTPTQETPMTDPTRPDDGWPHENLEPGSPAQLVYQALADDHPIPLTADEVLAEIGGPDVPEPEPGDDEVVAAALTALELDGVVTPSTREPDAVWMLHGPARLAADKATRDA